MTIPLAKAARRLRFGGEEAKHTSYQESKIVVLPAPYEATVSYGGGASRGPEAILRASAQLEMYDEELDTCPDQAGIFTLEPVALSGLTPLQAFQSIQKQALKPLQDKKLLLTLGGEHSVTCGVMAACRKVHGQAPWVLQIDAHADLRQSYQGSPYSHACVMARLHDMGAAFVQVGLRSLSQEERVFLRRKGLEKGVFWGRHIAESRDDTWMQAVVEALQGPLYITVDVDGLDPSVICATGTPEPGGLSFRQVIGLIKRVCSQYPVIGMDITELAPIAHFHAPDFIAAKLAYKMLGFASKGPTPSFFVSETPR